MATSANIGGELRQVTLLDAPKVNNTVVNQPVTNTTSLSAGQGPAGRDGSDGVSDKHYTFDQMSAASVWVVVHGLGKYPSVVVVDSTGSVVEGFVEYDSMNQLTLTFSGAFAGMAYLN